MLLTSVPEMTTRKGEGGPGAESGSFLRPWVTFPKTASDWGDEGDVVTDPRLSFTPPRGSRQQLEEADELASQDTLQELETFRSVMGHK